MKKFMFTAIAMIAFMGSSMANTIEVDNKTESSEVNCLIVAYDYLDAVDPDFSLTQEQVNYVYNIAYNTCLAANMFAPEKKE